METLNDIIWSDEDPDIEDVYGDPLHGTVCIVMCTIVTLGGSCSPPMPGYVAGAFGVACGC